jgi:N-acyl-L-homoserine lactone synthetase
LVDLTFVPKVHNGVQMGLRGIDESLFPIISPKLLGEVFGELQGPQPPVQRPRVWSNMGYFMDDRSSYRFRLPGNCGIFTEILN